MSPSPEKPSIVLASLPEFIFLTLPQKSSMVPSAKSLVKESALAVSSSALHASGETNSIFACTGPNRQTVQCADIFELAI